MTIIILISAITGILALITFVLSKINVYDRVLESKTIPYGFIISNNSDKHGGVIVYGNNQYLLSTNFGSDAPIQVTPSMSYVSYIQSLQQSAYEPFQINLIRITGKVKNIKQAITVTSADANGCSCAIPILVKNWMAEYGDEDMEKEVSVDVDFKVNIDGNTKLEFLAEPNSEIQWNIFHSKISFKKISVLKLLLSRLG